MQYEAWPGMSRDASARVLTHRCGSLIGGLTGPGGAQREGRRGSTPPPHLNTPNIAQQHSHPALCDVIIWDWSSAMSLGLRSMPCGQVCWDSLRRMLARSPRKRISATEVTSAPALPSRCPTQTLHFKFPPLPPPTRSRPTLTDLIFLPLSGPGTAQQRAGHGLAGVGAGAGGGGGASAGSAPGGAGGDGVCVGRVGRACTARGPLSQRVAVPGRGARRGERVRGRAGGGVGGAARQVRGLARALPGAGAACSENELGGVVQRLAARSGDAVTQSWTAGCGRGGEGGS